MHRKLGNTSQGWDEVTSSASRSDVKVTHREQSEYSTRERTGEYIVRIGLGSLKFQVSPVDSSFKAT